MAQFKVQLSKGPVSGTAMSLVAQRDLPGQHIGTQLQAVSSRHRVSLAILQAASDISEAVVM